MADRTSYNPRVPEQDFRYSQANDQSKVLDMDEGVPRNVGKTTGYDQRELHVRRDNDDREVVDFHRSFTEATEALILFIQNVIKPTIIVNNEIRPIPVMYVNAEKWATIQKLGYIKDEKGKTLAPVIAVRRTNFDNSYMPKLNGVRAYGNEVSFYKQHSTTNRYDNFNALNNQIPKKEIYSMKVPDWWKVDYEVVIWTELIEQVDKLIEDFYYYRGVPVGGKNRLKYTSDIIGTPTTETSNAQQEDRLVKCTLTFQLNVPIIQLSASDETNTKKELSIGKIYFGTETIIDEF